MNKLINLVRTLDYARLVLGICILVDGYPLIFFFRDALKLAPGSTAFTAVALAAGLVLMVPFTFLRRLYRPNETMFWMGVTFILLSIAYMFLFNGVPGFQDTGKDMIYYAYALIFFFLLINIPNDVVRVFIPVVVLFTLVSNLGLIYSLITNPNWVVGQRATITLGDDDSGGNPHVFSRNAFMGLIACAIWLLRAQTPVLLKLFALFAGAVNLAILVLTQTRSAIVALILAVIFFAYFNVRPAQIRATVRGLAKPIPIAVMALGFVALIFFLRRYYDTYGILYGYVMNFMERNLENVYAVLGLKAQGAAYTATLDASAANRSVSATFFSNVLVGHMHMLILGFGYKFLYLDVPVLEALTNQGIIGFILFGGVNLLCLYHAVRIMSYNPNPLSVFLAYFFMLVLVQIFTNGRPYEISFWFPLALMTRFLGVEHLFPDHLSDDAVPTVDEEFAVVPKPA
ncbi:O-antigen ligase family protein [Spirosoma pomorum]